MKAKLTEAQRFMKCFMDLWGHEYAEKRDSIDKGMWSDKSCTDFMIGEYDKNADDPKNAFLKSVCEEFGSKLRYGREWYTVDAYLYEENRQDWLDAHWHLIIEHENNRKMWKKQMWKLLHFKVPLKVLVGYDYSCDEKAKKQRAGAINKCTWRDCEIERLDGMNRDAYAVHPESGNTEYLLIVGNREKKQNGKKYGEIRWRFWRATPNTKFQEITDKKK